MSKSKELFSWLSANKEGHGDKYYESLEDFMNDNPDFERDKDDPESINRPWYGNGYNLTLEELKELKKQLININYYTTKDILTLSLKKN